MLIHDLHIRIVDAPTGELLRELTLNPAIDYRPTGAKSETTNTPNPMWVGGVSERAAAS